MPGPDRRPRAALALMVAGLLVAPLLPTSPASGGIQGLAAPDKRRGPTVIKVDASRVQAEVSPALLGTNHRFVRDGFGLWNPRSGRDGAPDSRTINQMRRVGMGSLRFPGGTTATMYDWRGAIGPVTDRRCQIEGHKQRDGFSPLSRRLSYGPDEFMDVIRASDAKPLIMTPFVNSSPADAAGWVEYMNAEVGTNPGGGVAWARVRARNGHPGTYAVHSWEVGNEAHILPQRYLFSHRPRKALRQYVRGGRRVVEREELGQDCSHPRDGVRSDGTPNQEFEALYAPAAVGRRDDLTVGLPDRAGNEWRRVNAADLASAAPRATVYAWDRQTATATFGNGEHGKVPAKGTVVRLDYTNRYAGFYAFARQMHAVDPSIRVCASWGTPRFAAVAGGRDFDCQTAHPITGFANDPVWENRREGHDRMMLGLGERRTQTQQIDRSLPAGVPLLLTEFGPIKGWDQGYTYWSSSMSTGVYMASEWATWLQLGIRWANGGALLGFTRGAVFGTPSRRAYGTEAVVREALKPMFHSGGRGVHSAVRRNPKRDPHLAQAGSYAMLSVAAARDRDGRLRLLVVNRAPNDDVRATVRLRGYDAAGLASVRRVVGRHYYSHNPAGEPRRVELDTNSRPISPPEFRMRFPAHSVTVLRMTRR